MKKRLALSFFCSFALLLAAQNCPVLLVDDTNVALSDTTNAALFDGSFEPCPTAKPCENRVFPSLAVDIVSAKDTPQYWTVLGLNGQVVFSQKGGDSIDIAALPQGLYIVRMNMPCGIFSQKVVKL